MIKKKKNEDLSDKNITFTLDKTTYKALRFYQAKMTVDAIVLEGEDNRKGIINFPFAHIPKATKKIIKPK